MVEFQLRSRGIRDERVLAAMALVPRELFVPEAIRGRAYDDAALAIGHEATISQPYMVAAICELLGLSGRELGDAFDRDDLGGELREHGGLVPRARADVEHALAPAQPQQLADRRDHVRLRDRRLVADR